MLQSLREWERYKHERDEKSTPDENEPNGNWEAFTSIKNFLNFSYEIVQNVLSDERVRGRSDPC